MHQQLTSGTRTQSHRGLIVLLGIMCSLGPMTVDMYLPAMPQIARDFATSEAAVQTTLTGSLLGMAVGMLLLGPLSDAVGRRWPLIAGLSVHAVFSVLSALAPDIGSLIVFRALQGAGSAAAPAIAVAIVRDISAGRSSSVRYSSILLIATGAPIVAPLIGSGMLLWTDWHGIFIVQGIMSAALVLTAIFALPETQPIRRSLRETNFVIGLKSVVRDSVFVGSALSQSAMMAASFCYISGLSFVAQDWYGASQQMYGLILSGGAVTMLFMNRLSPLLLVRFTPHKVALVGLAGAMTSAALMMIAAPTIGLAGVAAFSWLCIGFQQLVTPNNQAMGLRDHPAHAGVASALMGAASLTAAAIASPLIGLVGVDNGFTMAAGMFCFYGLSVIASTLVIGMRKELVR
ncbi:multidrug effflux MFS transporter [Parafrigoribacterium mesophilum]|uniref:multidrug effflux MFS transporter n=1 Tax=Parafrigoribacterium mesophilum TaxID=433646 RepID=UPI0031FE36B7